MRAYRTGLGIASDPEALKAVCLVSDLIIPDKNGLFLLHDMRSAGWSGPAILISGHLTDEWIAEATRHGFDEILAKPITERRLVDCIIGLLSRSPKSS